MENILNLLRDISQSNDIITIISFSLIIGLLTFILSNTKNLLVPLIVSLISCLTLIFGMNKLFPAFLTIMIIYLIPIGLSVKLMIEISALFAILSAISIYFQFDFRVPILLGYFIILVISVFNNIRFRFLSIITMGMILTIFSESSVMIMIPIICILGNGFSFQNNNQIMSWQRFKKFYLKKNIVDYQYLVISLYTDEKDIMTKKEREEIICFLNLVKDKGISILYDEFTYLIAYSNIKQQFGTSVGRVTEENISAISSAESLIKGRLVYPLSAESMRTFESAVEIVDTYKELEPTIKAMKEQHMKKASVAKGKMKGLGK